MIDDTRAERAVEYIRDHAKDFAKAKAERTQIEQFLKSKKALLMKEADANDYATAAAQETEALADPEYIALIDGLKVAVETEERIRWEMVAAELTVDIWRTYQANNRRMERTTS